MDELVDFMKDFIMNFLNFVGYAKCTNFVGYAKCTWQKPIKPCLSLIYMYKTTQRNTPRVIFLFTDTHSFGPLGGGALF